jgi:hypothetical protein
MAEESPVPYDTGDRGVCGVFNLHLYLNDLSTALMSAQQWLLQ